MLPNMPDYSASKGLSGSHPKDIRAPAPPTDLSPIDLRILAILETDARIPNSALAAAVGVAPSTCHGRVRALRESGVIRGFRADIDMAGIGRPIQALISVRMHSDARSDIRGYADRIAELPEVLNVYFVAGADDFLIQVATTDPTQLRDFVVERLSADPAVALTETNLIFEHVRPQIGVLHQALKTSSPPT